MLVIRHVGRIERLARALLAYGTLWEEDAIRGVADLPPAPIEVDWWTTQFEDAGVIDVGSIVQIAEPTPPDTRVRSSHYPQTQYL